MKNSNYLAIVGLMVLQCCYLTTLANVKLPKVFADSMVLQRNKPIKIWGWADKHEKISVAFHGQFKTVTANKLGDWHCVLDSEPAGGPYTLTVIGKKTLFYKDILVGELWVCSGQSNMEWPVKMSKNAEDEIFQADYSQIRAYKVPHQISAKLQNDFMQGGKWLTATSANVGDFTAAGYFFARELYNQLHVPIGIVDVTFGGSNIETWISRDAFIDDPYFSKLIKSLPPFQIDSLTSYHAKTTAQKVQELQGLLPALRDVIPWKEESFDDGQWPKMKLPGIWVLQQLNNVKGVVWYRKTIRLDTLRQGRTTLKLPFITQLDSTYVNGFLVGSSTNTPPRKRIYNIPAGVLKRGNNVIAIRISDSTGLGGMSGDAYDMRLLNRDTTIVLAGDWAFQTENIYRDTVNIIPNGYPSLLYNAMINPLISLSVKGVIWYQGESNAGRAQEYSHTFPLLISDWRKQWQQSRMPFLYVQLTSFNWAGGDSNKGSLWAELREAQTYALKIPNTGMVVTTDIGEADILHPKNKQDVGRRLAAIALKDSYCQRTNLPYPTFKSVTIYHQKAIINVENAGSGLVTPDKYSYVKGFEVAGRDRVFHFANASIKGNTIIVSSPKVIEPVAVRYAWADDASDANVFNQYDLPLAPFRTDDWKRITDGITYQILHIF